MGEFVTISLTIITLLLPYALGVIDFKDILLLLQQNWKYKVVQFLAYLLHLDTVVGGQNIAVYSEIIWTISRWHFNFCAH
jgi:hypothetical protein